MLKSVATESTCFSIPLLRDSSNFTVAATPTNAAIDNANPAIRDKAEPALAPALVAVDCAALAVVPAVRAALSARNTRSSKAR